VRIKSDLARAVQNTVLAPLFDGKKTVSIVSKFAHPSPPGDTVLETSRIIPMLE